MTRIRAKEYFMSCDGTYHVLVSVPRDIAKINLYTTD